MLSSLRSRLWAAFLVPTLAVFGGAGLYGYAVARDLLEDELGHSLCAVAASTASQLSAERLMSLEAGDDDGEGTRTFRNLSRQLFEVQKAARLRRVFAFDRAGRVKVDAGGALLVGTLAPELQRDQLELGRVFQGEAVPSQVLFEGKDGRLYKTGYAPLVSGEQVVGAVAVEGTAEYFEALGWLRRGFLSLLALSAALLGGLGWAVARTLSRPLDRLVHSALRIGGGDLETIVQPESTREIGILARELEAMRSALLSRDRQLKMMLAGVAHEVRNPIGGISLFAGLLAEELPAGADGARSHVQRIQKEIDYLQRIVEEFLTFAREPKPQQARVDASEWLSAVAELLRADAAAREVSLEVKSQPHALSGDPALLQAALVNLVRNAVQASGKGQQVRVEGRVEGERYVVEVADQGPGIDPTQLERIFEPFFTTREKGTGLGLPLARRIAEAHGGSLSVRSEPGNTRFSMCLSAKPSLSQ